MFGVEFDFWLELLISFDFGSVAIVGDGGDGSQMYGDCRDLLVVNWWQEDMAQGVDLTGFAQS